MGVLGGVFVLKSGLRILIRAPEVPFSVPPITPKMGHFGCFWLFWGYRKWHFGCPNQNSKTTVQYKYPPYNPHLDTLGAILDPGKVIFDHIIAFGHFPIEIPIEAKKSTHMGRKGRKAKTKTVLKPVPSGKTWDHAKFNILNFVK